MNSETVPFTLDPLQSQRDMLHCCTLVTLWLVPVPRSLFHHWLVQGWYSHVIFLECLLRKIQYIH